MYESHAKYRLGNVVFFLFLNFKIIIFTKWDKQVINVTHQTVVKICNCFLIAYGNFPNTLMFSYFSEFKNYFSIIFLYTLDNCNIFCNKCNTVWQAWISVQCNMQSLSWIIKIRLLPIKCFVPISIRQFQLHYSRKQHTVSLKCILQTFILMIK